MINLTKSQVERWVSKNFPDYKIRKSSTRGDIYLVNNPYDIDDTKHHLGIASDGKWVKDYRPNFMSLVQGSLLRFISKYRKCTIHDAIKEVCGDDTNIAVLLAEARRELKNKDETDVQTAEAEPVFKLPDNVYKLTDNTHALARQTAINYLSNRAISEDTAIEYGIMYNAVKLCFPYYEYGEIVYWQSREYLNKIFEFPNAKTMGVDKSNFLYGFDNVEPGEPVIITEAIFNSISVGPGCVATGGADIQKGQIRRLKALNPPYIILAPDNDGAGKASVLSNYEKLTGYFKDIRYCIPPVKKDWNDFAKMIKKAGYQNKYVRAYIDKHTKPLDISARIALYEFES